MEQNLAFEQFASNTRYAFSPSVAASDETVHGAWLELSEEEGSGGTPRDWDVTLRTTSGEVETDAVPRRPTLLAGQDSVHLFWTAERDERWPLFHATLDALGDPEQVTDGSRHPLDVTGCRSTDGVAVAWESAGDESVIRGCRIADGALTTPQTLSTGCERAYDASIAAAPPEDDADYYLLYTALRDGWYDVLGRRLVDDAWTAPQVLSRQSGLAAYPTVVADDGWTDEARTGTWIAWVDFDPLTETRSSTFVQNRTRADQHAPFRGSRSIVLRHWDGDRLRRPEHVPDERDGTRPALIGGDALRLACLEYGSQQDRPRIAVSRLGPDGWTDPVRGPVYGDAERLHYTTCAGTAIVATGRDTRPMGGWDHFETEAHDGGSSVGTLRLDADDAGSVSLRDRTRWIHSRRDARNPGVDVQSDDGRDLLFLNLHRHTDLSVCIRHRDGEPDFNVRLGRDLVREDAICFTDHCYNNDVLARFKQDRAMRFYTGLGCVTIPSYEWTGTHAPDPDDHYGHFNVHWFEDGMPPIGSPRTEMSPMRPGELDAALEGHDAVAIPHHTADDYHYLRPDLFEFPHAPVVEIFQAVRGTCETRTGPGSTESPQIDDDRCYVRSALEDGHHLGFVGGGDHAGIALTGVWVEEQSRRGIYEALGERRCFATTGTTLAVDATVGNTPMGGVHEPSPGTETVTYSLNATVPEGVDTVQVIRDGEIVHRFGGGESLDASLEVDRDPTADQYLYARLLLENGEVAWVSPIRVAGAATTG